MPVLTGIDLLGIQAYIFASNRLRDVLAASWMVEHVTSPDVLCQWGLNTDQVLLAAGGNAIVEFDSLDKARTWTTRYTRWLLENAPGLEAVVAHRPYDNRPLAWGIKALSVELAHAKLERRPNAPQLGISVTATCAVTGLPANANTHVQSELLSYRIASLREKYPKGKTRWQKFLPNQLAHMPGWRPDFPDDLDHLGRSHGDTSLIGIVHVDGNGVGKAISNWLDRCLKDEVDDTQVREQYGVWSRSIKELCDHVLKAVITRVTSCIQGEANEHGKQCFVRGTPHELGFPLRDDETRREVFLPLRPVLLGGDDLTFVCDGRIALDLAAAALREFEKNPIPHPGEGGTAKTLTACAGVALVKSHAPFHRSYDLAESLCASAKRKRREVNERQHLETRCWLDWQIGPARPSETVEDLRTRKYKRDLHTMRPYPLVSFDDRNQSWDWLDKALLGPGTTQETEGFRGASYWAESRSRVKRLGSLVTEGTDSIQRQVEAWKAIEQNIQLPAALPEGGFIGQETPLLDAIELLDIHIRLEPDHRKTAISDIVAANEETTR